MRAIKRRWQNLFELSKHVNEFIFYHFVRLDLKKSCGVELLLLQLTKLGDRAARLRLSARMKTVHIA